MPEQVAPDVVQDRYTRLVEVVNEIAWQENQKLEGRQVEVLIAQGEGRKDNRTERLSGRAQDNRLVHVAACDARPGDIVTATVTYAAPHHLVADDVVSIRRTPAGDLSEAPVPGILLGMPPMPRSTTPKDAR